MNDIRESNLALLIAGYLYSLTNDHEDGFSILYFTDYIFNENMKKAGFTVQNLIKHKKELFKLVKSNE